jgi:hypothetical protein
MKAKRLLQVMEPVKMWCLVRDGEFACYTNSMDGQSPYAYRTRRDAKDGRAFRYGDKIVRTLVSFRVEQVAR